MSRPPTRRLLAAALAAAALTVGAGLPAHATSPQEGLPGLVTLERIRQHQRALQRIAEAHGGNRAAGHPGYDASARYVREVLTKAGYQPRSQRFDFDYFELTGKQVLAQTAPAKKDYPHKVHFNVYQPSPSGTVDAAVTALSLPCGGGVPTAFPKGDIALFPIDFACWRDQAVRAQAAGASAVLYDYPDQARQATAGAASHAGHGLGADKAKAGTAADPEPKITVPLLDLDAGDARKELRKLAGKGLRLHLETRTRTESRPATNVLAETRRDLDPENQAVVMVGAHLDSVPEGPGSNDNGSGTATVLAIAEQLARTAPTRNSVRFAFWGAEEVGLLGSKHYTGALTERERSQLALYLNFDMLGSPNHVRFVLHNAKFPAGSATIEKAFTTYLTARGLASELVADEGRSDHGPFAKIGVPVGGVDSGAEKLKTTEQARTYGGTAGKPYDPCYHQACDNLNNVHLTGLDQLADAAAHAVARFAKSVRDVRPGS